MREPSLRRSAREASHTGTPRTSTSSTKKARRLTRSPASSPASMPMPEVTKKIGMKNP